MPGAGSLAVARGSGVALRRSPTGASDDGLFERQRKELISLPVLPSFFSFNSGGAKPSRPERLSSIVEKPAREHDRQGSRHTAHVIETSFATVRLTHVEAAEDAVLRIAVRLVGRHLSHAALYPTMDGPRTCWSAAAVLRPQHFDFDYCRPADGESVLGIGFLDFYVNPPRRHSLLVSNIAVEKAQGKARLKMRLEDRLCVLLYPPLLVPLPHARAVRNLRV